jgi:hypothetical protein
MSDPEKQSRDVIMVTIAWAQFLAMAAVIDKADMRNLRSAGERVLSSPWLWQWDWTKVSGVAVAQCFSDLFARCSGIRAKFKW